MTDYSLSANADYKIFFTSDTHFYHQNIIKYCNRPFNDASHMNESIIANWNSVVGPNDIVFHLGDFGLGSDVTRLVEIRHRLNGRIVLITGNHDRGHIEHQEFLDLFEKVAPEMFIRIDKQQLYLNHKPMLCFDGGYDGKTYQMFGHVHSGPRSTGNDSTRLKFLLPSQYDVGMDNNEYTPVSWDKVKTIISKQFEAFNKK